MPKKDYGPATRKSQRRTTASEEPILRAEDREETLAGTKAEGPEPEEPARLALGEKREPDRPLPSIEENEESEEYDSALENNSSELEEKQAAYFLPPNPKLTTVKTTSTMPEGSNNGHPPGEMEQLLQRIARLEAEANNSAYNEREHSTRGITPINSAFGGADFRPVGFAAHPAFRPFGADQPNGRPRTAARDQRGARVGDGEGPSVAAVRQGKEAAVPGIVEGLRSR